MIILLVIMLCLMIVYVVMEVSCRKIGKQQNVYAARIVDKLGCIKAFIATFFMVCGGFFAKNMNEKASVLMNQSNDSFIEFFPYFFFVLGGLLFVFAIASVIQYRKNYYL